MPFHASYYNVIAPYEGDYLVYNTLHRTLARLTAQEHAQLAAIESCKDAELVAQLDQLNFILTDPESEVEAIRAAEDAHRDGNRTLEFTITPQRQCNFACDYCYVPTRSGVITSDIAERIVQLAACFYDDDPFEEFRCIWYGGEPLLALDPMEDISQRLMVFCRERNIRYLGHILTNGSLATKEVCERLAQRCGITSVMPTLSGKGEMQDLQRCAKNGEKYFDTIIQNIDNFLAAGIAVRVNYVVNHNNFEGCRDLACDMCRKPGMHTRLTRTYRFGKDRFYTDATGNRVKIDLFAPEEFGAYYAAFYRSLNPTSADYESILKPVSLNCAGWVNRDLFIDEVGDVFACMVDNDYPEYAIFNLLEWDGSLEVLKQGRYLDYAALHPTDDPECRICPVLPQCQGNCSYNWLEFDPPHHDPASCSDLKFAIGQLVVDYYEALVREREAGIGPDERTREVYL